MSVSTSFLEQKACVPRSHYFSNAYLGVDEHIHYHSYFPFVYHHKQSAAWQLSHGVEVELTCTNNLAQNHLWQALVLHSVHFSYCSSITSTSGVAPRLCSL